MDCLPAVLLYKNIYLPKFVKYFNTRYEQYHWFLELSAKKCRCTKVPQWSPAILRDLKLSALSIDAIRHHNTRWNLTSIIVALKGPQCSTWPLRLTKSSALCTWSNSTLARSQDRTRPYWRNPPLLLGKRRHPPSWNASYCCKLSPALQMTLLYHCRKWLKQYWGQTASPPTTFLSSCPTRKARSSTYCIIMVSWWKQTLKR